MSETAAVAANVTQQVEGAPHGELTATADGQPVATIIVPARPGQRR